MPNGQTWVIVVGDSSIYGSFDNFESVIDSSQVQESWVFDSSSQQWTYQAQVTVDTITIGYAWIGDSTLVGPTTGVENIDNAVKSFNVFPNPTQNTVTVDLSRFDKDAVALVITNMLGQQVYRETFAAGISAQQTINTGKWADGLYLISIETEHEVLSKRLIKN